MFARTPIGKLPAFSGVQFGRPVYLSSVDVNELKKWTVISGHDTIAALAVDLDRTSHISVELHTQCDSSLLARLAATNRGSAALASHAQRSVLDDRGEWMTVTQQTIDQVAIFTGRVDMTKTALSNRSRNLFTFSAIHQANQQLLADHKQQSVEDRVAIAVQFWNTVAANMPDWQAAYDEEILPADYRREFVCAHGIALAGLARVGRSLLAQFPKTWPGKLKKLRTLN